MHEPIAGVAARQRRRQPGALGLFNGVEHRVGARIDDTLQQVEREGPADHPRCRQHLAHLVAQPFEAAADGSKFLDISH